MAYEVKPAPDYGRRMSSENIGWDPSRVDLLWDLKERPKRGPKPALTVRQIATQAMEVADGEGLGAVSMQRVADELGVGTMTLYTYVPDKASLLEVMLDLAFEDALVEGQESWRLHLEAGARAILDSYQRHPWAIQILVGGPPLGPSQMRFLERALQSLSGTGLDDEEKLNLVLAVTSYVRGAAHLNIGLSQGPGTDTSDEALWAEYSDAYARALDPVEFPVTSQIFSQPAAETSDPSDLGFDFGLQLLIDGIDAFISSRAQD